MQETRVQYLGQEDLLEKQMATHSSILAWKIPWTEEPGRLSDFTFTFFFTLCPNRAPQAALVVKNPPANAGDSRDPPSIPESGRCPEGGNGNSLQYSCLENSINRGAWRSTVRGVAKRWTWLSTQHILPYSQLSWPRFYSTLFALSPVFQQSEFNRLNSWWSHEFRSPTPWSLASSCFCAPVGIYLCCIRTWCGDTLTFFFF